MSSLDQAVTDYLTLRRGLGFKLRDEGWLLPDFVSFLERKSMDHVTINLAIEWATLPTGTLPSHWTRRLTMVRQFAIHQSAIDPRTEVPPIGVLPFRYRRTQPYIYRDDEIVRLIRAAKKLRTYNGMRPKTYAALFGLLAVTGMRIGEVIALDREDVDLVKGIVTVHQGKFGKSRLIPVHASTSRALRRYASCRDRIYPNPKTPALFLAERGSRPTQWAVRWTFVKLSRQIGLRGENDSHGPRMHDLRHAFAVRTFLGWYRDGVDVEARVPHLATYLGHGHVTDTYWYLSAVPELLRLAAARLETGS